MKEGYKYFPCANEYKTEEEIAIGGEKEAWRVTKLSNREFGRTRAQTQELEVANAMEELSSSNELENRRKEAAKVDAATSLFVLREVEKEKGKAVHFARERPLDGVVKMYKCAIYPTAKQKVMLKKLMEAEICLFIQLCRSRDKQAYRGRKKVVRREEEVAREGRREDH